MAKFKEEELLGQLYADNLMFKAQIKLLKEMVIAVASSNGKEKVGNALHNFYITNYPKYYEDQILLSPMKDEYLQKQAEDFLKRLKEEL